MCVSGKLYAVEAWIRAGKSISVDDGFKRTPLGVAVKTGFHSLIELLLRHESSQEAKNDALQAAVAMRRFDLVQLTVAYGAEASAVSFADALFTWDRRIAVFLLERGADPVTNLPFVDAFTERIRTALGAYLDCRRAGPDLAPQLQAQADMALRHFAREGNVKWASLLMWAGADPRSVGPTVESRDDPEMFTTAIRSVQLGAARGLETPAP